LENNFASDFPDLGKVGVEVVTDVVPYEETKIRILNGGHTGLAYLGALAGHATFDQAMHDQDIRAHFDAWERDEVLKGLDSNIPFDTAAYLGQIARRFENGGIADNLERICMDGYSKMSIYIRPTLAACLKLGMLPKAGFDCIASWVIYARRVQEGVCKIPYHEPLWDRVAPLVAAGNETRLASDADLWGDLPKRYDEFVPSLVAAIEEMDKKWRA
jgi:D-arabinitol 4-dehydrogenase